MTLERKAVGALLLDTALLIAAGIALLFGIGCGGTMRAPTPEEAKTIEARTWREGLGRIDAPPAVLWRHDTGCGRMAHEILNPYTGHCVDGFYVPAEDRIEVSAARPLGLAHEFAHAIVWRDHPDIDPRTHHDRAEFWWEEQGAQDFMERLLGEMGVLP